MQVLRLFLDIPVRFISYILDLEHGFSVLITSNFLSIHCDSVSRHFICHEYWFLVTITKQVPLVRVFRARIGRRIAMADSTSDGAMGGGNMAAGSNEELHVTGMEEEEEAAVIESVISLHFF